MVGEAGGQGTVPRPKDGAAGNGGGRRGRRWLIGILVLVALAWTAGWWWLRGEVAARLDAELARLAGRGLEVTCADRSIEGFPFRIELRCGRVAVADRVGGHSAAFAAGRAVALIYRPTHAIVELDGPGTVTAPDGVKLEGNWRLLQASLRFGDGRLQRASLAVDGLEGGATRPYLPPVTVKSERLELHLRPDPDRTGFDVAASVTAGALAVDGKRIGPEKTDVAFDTEIMRLPAAASGAAAAGFLPAWAANDGRVDIRSLRFATGKLAVEGRGAFGLETDGTLTGMLKLTATGLDAVSEPPAKAAIGPDVAVLASGFLLFGRPAGTEPKAGRSLDFTIDQGRMKLGSTPLGRLPPLFRTGT